jgi:cytochrome d ubiquinol oxidase subunit II
MATIWYVLIALMLTGYVLLDGFDLGAGALHLFGARSEQERRLLLRSIGPVWDGNEVWLLAAGGTLFFAFPLLYASSFSGFYLPLNIVLWLLVLRAVGIEFRMHLESPVWRDFFDAVFSLSSALLVIFFGAALGNVLRGVPLGADHYFFAPLWTDFRPGAEPGVLDWYTVLTAVLATASLMLHGALYVAVKTDGALNARMRRISGVVAPVAAVLAIVALAATLAIRPALLNNYYANPAGWLLPALVAGGLAGVMYFRAAGRQGQERVPLFVRVHYRDAGRRGLRAVSEPAARQRGGRERDHDSQCGCRPGIALHGLDLVDCRDADRFRLLCVRIPHVPGQSARRGRPLLSLWGGPSGPPPRFRAAYGRRAAERNRE